MKKKVSEPIFFYLLCLCGYLTPYLFYWRRIGTGDWDAAATFAQIAVWWYQLGNFSTTWNPFLCGGYPLFANPQIPLFHPSLPLLWAFGPTVGLKMTVLVWMSLGFWLSFLFARSFDFNRRDASLFSSTWVLNGFFVAHLSQMHSLFVCFFLIPGFYLFTKRWVETREPKFLLALTVLLFFSAIGSYAFFAYFLISLPFYFVFEIIFRKVTLAASIRLSIPFFLSIIATLGMLSFYLWPVMAYMKEFPRAISPEFENPLKLITFLFFPGRFVSVDYFTWEYQFFVGPVLFLFFVLAFKNWKKIPVTFRPLLACALLHTLLAMGSLKPLHLPFDFKMPLDLARDFIPGFSNVRVVSRFLIGAIPAILILALWEWRRRGIGWKSIVLVLGPLIGFQLNNTFTVAFNRSELAEKKISPIVDTNFKWKAVGENKMYSNLSSHTGITDCYDPTPKPGTAWKNFSGPLLQSASEVPLQWSRTDWGHLTFSRQASQEETLRLRMNFHRDWKIKNHTENLAALISTQTLNIQVPTGQTDFELIFSDESVAEGIHYSLMALAVYLLFFFMVTLWRSKSPTVGSCLKID